MAYNSGCKVAQSIISPPGTGATRNEQGIWVIDGKIWLPSSRDSNLVLRVMIVAHCGVRAHRGADAMLQILRDEFAFEDMSKKVDNFVATCLLCKHVKGGSLIQRPWNITHKTTRRNELLHMDFLHMGESYGYLQYVLVLKDDISHFCELVACESANGLVAANAVLDWYKRFGLPEMWQSDNGSHFRNILMDDLKARLGALHRFVPALLLEFELDTRNWVHLLPVLQSNLNHTPVRSLRGKSPVEVFTGLDREPIMNVVVKTREGPNLRASLTELHADIADDKDRRRLRQQAAKRGKACTFSVGDYVLWSRADPRMTGRKLMVRGASYKLPDRAFLTGEKFDVHAIRLKHYADNMLEVTEELEHHIGLQGLKLGVREITNARYNSQARLEKSEDLWESLASIYGAVPDKVERYVGNSTNYSLRKFFNTLHDTNDE
ncbi:Hypothetical protein PHPALM_36473 [Phytophthora palmivora]|uniref:Integrase catalytic domain-containing protein n=1 Tax=Phytophthora palmivora TaxID=4796 RepID=A0A2P4WZV2_9STRA|nr:Hypothetical protein PHPALM_36473 [Phytophthora palmivora]